MRKADEWEGLGVEEMLLYAELWCRVRAWSWVRRLE